MTTLNEVVLQLVDEIQTASTARRVSGDGLRKLNRSVRKLVSDSLSVYSKSSTLHSYASVHKNSNHYTTSRYRKNSSYRIHVGRAYEGLIRLGYIKEMKRGYFDGFGGFLTRYRATEKLRMLFADHDVRILPVLMSVDPPGELIQVKEVSKQTDQKTGKQKRRSALIEYKDTQNIRQMRLNVDKINKNLSTAWVDLELDDYEWKELRYWLKQEADKDVPPHNLASRAIYRVFSNTSFDEGGRFYGGWWQNIPKQYRKKLLINGKRTVEFDYSGLHPAILYARSGTPFPEDPYDIGLDAKHRGSVKKAMNAMLNAKKELSSPPRGFPLKEIGIRWVELKKLIKAKHPDISDYFGTGEGLRLQYIDSCLAEELMLRFIDEKSDTALLPVHDSFIVHHGYASELKDMMLETFEKNFGDQIAVKELEKEFSHIADRAITPVSKDVTEVIQLNNVGYELRLDAHRKYNLSQG